MSTIQVALLEHLPRLQCVNVHIQYKQAVIEDDAAAAQGQPPPTVPPARFAINNARIAIGERTSVELPRCLYINAATLSRFVHTPGHISFRVCTDRANTFDEELLCRVLPSAMRLQQPPHAKPALLPSVRREQRVQLRCVDCCEPLSEFIAFERVLPLPSDNLDADEWFCHHRHGEHSHAAASADAAAAECGELDNDEADAAVAEARTNAGKINARPLDLLYGQYCFVLHYGRLINTSVRHQRYVHCACGTELGEYYRHTETVKLWNETVSYAPHQLANGTLDTAQHGDPAESVPPMLHMFAGNAYAHFVRILRKVIEDFDLLMSSVAMPQTIRCLFSSHTAAAVNNGHGDDDDCTGKRSFLFVQVMNAEVDVWRYSADDEDNDIVDGVEQTVALQRNAYIKIMYCMVEVAGTVPPPPLVASWQSDVTVNSVGLCDRMLQEAMVRIVDNARLLPEFYRKQSTGGFRMSYLW